MSFAPNIEEIIAPTFDVKNTNKQVHLTSTFFDKLCIFCDKNENNLVAHYIKQHPNYEVPIARPSPVMAHRMRQQLEAFKKTGPMISGFCYLCEGAKTMRKYGWEMHLLGHTGEQQFHCQQCKVNLKAKSHHKNCNGNPTNIFEVNASDGSLMCFMCKDCNYTQISRDRMIKHQIMEHKNSGDERYFEKITMVPNLSPLKCDISYHYIDADTCLKCTICGEQTSDGDEFIAHFDTYHGQEKQYECCCGEKITLDGCNVSGSYIAVHFLEHGADLYYCTACEESQSFRTIYFTQTEVQNHLLNEHPDRKFQFQHAYRDLNGQTLVTEFAMENMKCRVCKLRIDGCLVDAENHFNAVHQTQVIDVMTILVKKSMDLNGRTISSNGEKYNLYF